MQIVLIGKGYFNRLILSPNTTGSYWIVDKIENQEIKRLQIEAMDGKCLLKNEKDIELLKHSYFERSFKWIREKDDVILEEYDSFGVRFSGSSEMFFLFCLPLMENFIHFSINNTDSLSIGSNEKNMIVYRNDLILDYHAVLKYDGEKWLLENYDSKSDVYVNGKVRHKDARTVRNGDVIFIMGMKIILMDHDIYVSNPSGLCTFDPTYLKIVEESDDYQEVLGVASDKDDNDYFSRSPRLINLIERETVKIDSPPQGYNEKDETPMIFTIGASLTMSVMLVMNMIKSIESYIAGSSDKKQFLFSIIPSAFMLIGMLILPIVSAKYERGRKKKKEKKRQTKYLEYLEERKSKIEEIYEKQKEILLNNYLNTKDCEKIILNRDSRLWERGIEDIDFLSVRLGLGEVPLEIDIQSPTEQFSVEEDNMLKKLNEIVESSQKIQDVPIVFSFMQKNVVALISKNYGNLDKYLKEIIIQLITFQSYKDLKLVFLLQEKEIKKWEYVKMLPHVWDNENKIRFFAHNYDEMNEISKYLLVEFENRLHQQKDGSKLISPYYLIIVDDYKKVENLKVITEILKNKNINIGFGIFCITNDMTQLPNECDTFINLQENSGVLFESQVSSTSQKRFEFDTKEVFYFEKILQSISNIPMRFLEAGNSSLPSHYSFLEMFDVGRIEQLNVVERWNKNDSTLSLKAPIGIDKYGNLIYLDIHEKFHGPHGLIAGSTGSGKSEFIITYILSMAVNYHPDDVAFILIDYKGGGLAGAFQKRKSRLPHLVGTITNIDTVELQRSLVSIKSELKRRQIVFNQARDLTDEGTIDIYKYQTLYHKGIVKEAIPHLLIICDEFAELKQQQPEFMDELMSVSRIGRSLGVHLILATQKPAGIVNDQIRSNSKFAICLKVQDKSDSMDVIKKPDAAMLQRAGLFYLQVGYDEYFVLGQSGWSGAPYIPQDRVEKTVDRSVEFVSNTGMVIYKIDNDNTQNNAIKQGEQLTSIVKYLSDLAQKEGIKETSLWKESIPKEIYLSDIKDEYHVEKEKYEIKPIIGVYDDPENQNQDIISLDISNNVLIYGNAESGKETLISTIIYDLITTYQADEFQGYILDFGNEALKIYKDAPQIGDVVFANDVEKIERFFKFIQKEILQRKARLSDYNGDYKLFLENTNEKMPMIVVVLNNFEGFMELYGNRYEEDLLALTRECVKSRIVFIMSVSSYSGMRYRLSQNLKQKIALRMNNKDDYINIFEKDGKKKFLDAFGRGLIMLESSVFEFQTAMICDAEEYYEKIKYTIGVLNEECKVIAKPIPVLPKKVEYNDVKEACKDLTSVPLGISRKDLKIYCYNFKSNLLHLMVSKNLEKASQYIVNILNAISKIPNVNIGIFDVEGFLYAKKGDLHERFQNMISKIQEDKNKQNVIAIVGVDKFVAEYEKTGDKFLNVLKSLEESANCTIILLENDNKIKNYEYSDWYKEYIQKENGIWIGNGIDNQYAITILERKDLQNRCDFSFGYVVKQGIPNLIKLLEMDGDENNDG